MVSADKPTDDRQDDEPFEIIPPIVDPENDPTVMLSKTQAGGVLSDAGKTRYVQEANKQKNPTDSKQVNVDETKLTHLLSGDNDGKRYEGSDEIARGGMGVAAS